MKVESGKKSKVVLKVVGAWLVLFAILLISSNYMNDERQNLSLIMINSFRLWSIGLLIFSIAKTTKNWRWIWMQPVFAGAFALISLYWKYYPGQLPRAKEVLVGTAALFMISFSISLLIRFVRWLFKK